MLGEIKETLVESHTILERRYLTKELRLELDKETCIGCGVCEIVCLKEAIVLDDATIIDGRLVKKPEVVIDAEKCVICGTCVVFCPPTHLERQQRERIGPCLRVPDCTDSVEVHRRGLREMRYHLQSKMRRGVPYRCNKHRNEAG